MRGLVFTIIFLFLGLAKAELFYQIAPNGVIKDLRLNNSLLLQNLKLAIVKPGWEGSYFDQDNSTTIKEQSKGVFQGKISLEGKVVAFQEKIVPLKKGLEISYHLESEADLPIQGVIVFATLPASPNAGSGKWFALNTLSDSLRQGVLPEKLPSPYVLLGGVYDEFGWTVHDGKHLHFKLFGANSIQFQDDRQFNANTFELQIYAKTKENGMLRKGEKIDLKVRLSAMEKEEAEKELEKIQKEIERRKVVPMSSAKPLKIKSVEANAKQVKAYGKFELTLDIDATFDNPFDPNDISVFAYFTSPSGKTIKVRGFYFQDYEITPGGLKRKGEPIWKVRFSPTEEGTYRYYILVKDRNGEAKSKEESFQVKGKEGEGFIRRSEKSPYYLRFDSGKSFFAIGENMCWGSLENYERWLKELGDSGGNYIRVWMCPWHLSLEWSPTDPGAQGDYQGLGKYALDNAWRVDKLIEMAHKNGIYIMLCLGYHGELSDQQLYFGEQRWEFNPYNKKNGGPCEKPGDFWTNEIARKFYKQRLEYIVARWGYSTNILSYEFWNEVNAPASWVEEMANYVKSIDPFKHLCTTTYGDDAVWRIRNMDYSQIHHYGVGDQPDFTLLFHNACREHTEKFQKPFLIGEFGIDFRKSDVNYDEKGLGTSMHNGMWSALMSRSMGTAMIWYWDNYVHPKKLYREFTPIAKFVADIPWAERVYDFIKYSEPHYIETKPRGYGDVTFQPTMGWGRSTGTEFTILRTGKIEGRGSFSNTLYSPGKPELKAPLIFFTDYPENGKFLFTVNTVSSSCEIVVRVDGEERYVLRLPEDDEGYKDKKWQEQWSIYQYIYDKEFGLEIPKGKHKIEIENRSGDWVSISRYRLTNYRDLSIPDVDILGLCGKDEAILWIHDKQSTWLNDMKGKFPQKMDAFTFELLGLEDGNYEVQWWDTREGKIVRKEMVGCNGGKLPLKVVDLLRDIAAKIRKK
ncbi:DUF5060 domain-containing protein [bacterium]|nr:DUF5060 domain-containing protein [bacterium]